MALVCGLRGQPTAIVVRLMGGKQVIVTMQRKTNRLDEIAAEFAELDLEERLELLLDYASKLPRLTPEYQHLRDTSDSRVHECMTPVYLWVAVKDGHVQIHAEVAEEAPTVKGFVAILVEAFSGAAPQEVLSVQPNLLLRLGLLDAIGMVRLRGLSAIENRIRRAVQDSKDDGGKR
jgi:cysteine desulfuration protein SufE